MSLFDDENCKAAPPAPIDTRVGSEFKFVNRLTLIKAANKILRVGSIIEKPVRPNQPANYDQSHMTIVQWCSASI